MVALEGTSASMRSENSDEPKLYMNVHAVSSLTGNVKRLAGMVAKMSKTSPSASVCDSSYGVWSRRPFRLLLDSCSDAHIISEKSAFLFLVAPDVKEIEVGKQGESVGFAGMGPWLLR